MAAFSGTVTWEGEDLKRVGRGLDLLARSGAWLPPILAQIGEVVVDHTDDRWGREVGPDGRPWKPLSKEWLEKKRKRGWILKKLQRTGEMRATLAWMPQGDHAIAVGVNKEYASFHQNPGSPGRFRPFLGFEARDQASSERIVGKAISEILEG